MFSYRAHLQRGRLLPAGGSAGCWGWRCGLDALSASFLPPTSPSWQPSRPLPAHHGRVPSPKRSAPTRLRAMMMLALLLWRRAASPSNVGRPEGCRPRMPARFTAVTLHTVVTLAAAPSHDRVIPRCGHVVGRHPIAQCVPAPPSIAPTTLEHMHSQATLWSTAWGGGARLLRAPPPPRPPWLGRPLGRPRRRCRRPGGRCLHLVLPPRRPL